MAKEPLCGSQPTNLSLVIAVLRFPSCSVVLPFQHRKKQGGLLEKRYQAPFKMTKYGKRGVSADTDLRLCKYFGLTDGYFAGYADGL
jgi:hypothetical protein